MAKKKDEDEEIIDVTEDQEDFVEIELDPGWTVKSRLEALIVGSQLSADEIIKSLYKPMNLIGLADEKYKVATEGRSFAIKTASEVMTEIERLETRLEKILEGKNPDEKIKGNLAEMHSKDKI